MDSSNWKNNWREKDQHRVDILITQLEIYQIMAFIFFDYIQSDQKIDAMVAAAEEIRDTVLNSKVEL